MRIDGAAVEATPMQGADEDHFIARSDRVIVFENGEAYEFTLDTGERARAKPAAGDGAILSPMPGKIVSVAAKAGAKLKKGDPILVLEAMKMEHTLTAPFDGKLVELNAQSGRAGERRGWCWRRSRLRNMRRVSRRAAAVGYDCS